MLSCKNLALSVRNADGTCKQLFSELSFTAHPGEIMMVLGKNGTGKSTLLKTLVGHVPAQCGSIRIFDRELAHFSKSELAQIFAFVLQDNERGTIREFSVEENLCFALHKGTRLSLLRPAVSQKNQEKISTFLQAVAPVFRERLSQKAGSLSGGQRQMLSILMNILSDAKIFLLDEPTAALDDTTAEEIMQELQNWVRERKLIALMVSHDLVLVERYGDRILDLNSPTAAP